MSEDFFTVKGFCEAVNISKALFYELQKRGKAPLTVKVGRRTLITRGAFEAWIKELEAIAANDNRNATGATKQARGRK